MSSVCGGLNEAARRHLIGCSSARFAFDARARFGVFSLGPKCASPPSNRIRCAKDRIVDPHIVAQVGYVVAFALAVGVVLHAVERQVVQSHLIVAIAHQHLGDGSRHELGDRGGCRQLRGDRGGQQCDGAGGEGIEVFAVDHGVDPAAQFHQVLVGFQNQEGPVERHGDAHGGVQGVARVAEGQHVAVADFVDLDELFDREHLARGVAKDLALGCTRFT